MRGTRAKDIRRMARAIVTASDRYTEEDYKPLYKRLKRKWTRGY